ncbi:hypothetical protein H0N99_04010 [Candidatus Micrarchaeota archaeon]|nr:hypothetical protein [Candidatus Micrarchaeota archaeon]
MKFKLIILLFFMGIADARELIAYQTGTVSFSGCNCRGDGDPNPVEFSISVINPSKLPLTLSYQWYDPSIDFYRPGNWIRCGYATVLSPQSTASCTLRIYTMMGGMNGTSYPNIILAGTDGIHNYTESFDIVVNYHTSPYEMNVLSRMQSVEYDFNQVASSFTEKCYGGSCCGMPAVKDNLSLALGNLSAANESLRACQLSSSWNYIMNAANSIRAANNSLIPLKNNCSAAISLLNDTGLRLASVSKLILGGRKCGSNVTASELQLMSANSSLNEAMQALASNDYGLIMSNLKDANTSLSNAVKYIGKCPSNIREPVVTPVRENSTNSSSSPAGQTSSGGDTALFILGAAFLALLILAAAVAIALPLVRRQPRSEKTSKLPSPPPPAPPAQPPQAQPPQAANPIQDIHEDLEKEFNEWLDSHSKK